MPARQVPVPPAGLPKRRHPGWVPLPRLLRNDEAGDRRVQPRVQPHAGLRHRAQPVRPVDSSDHPTDDAPDNKDNRQAIRVQPRVQPHAGLRH